MAKQKVGNPSHNTNSSEYLRVYLKEKFTAALQHLKKSKVPAPDSIFPELIIPAGAALKSWSRDFRLSFSGRLEIIFKIWITALLVVISMPMKPVDHPKSYQSISLLRAPYKILERFIYACLKPIIDPLLSPAGWVLTREFNWNSTVDFSSIKQRKFPDALKKAKIIPIFKKGDVILFTNYRPVSILPQFSKIYLFIYLSQTQSP